MKVAVLGAGAWGTALAGHLALRHDTVLWARFVLHRGLDNQERVDCQSRIERRMPGCPSFRRIILTLGF